MIPLPFSRCYPDPGGVVTEFLHPGDREALAYIQHRYGESSGNAAALSPAEMLTWLEDAYREAAGSRMNPEQAAAFLFPIVDALLAPVRDVLSSVERGIATGEPPVMLKAEQVRDHLRRALDGSPSPSPAATPPR